MGFLADVARTKNFGKSADDLNQYFENKRQKELDLQKFEMEKRASDLKYQSDSIDLRMKNRALMQFEKEAKRREQVVPFQAKLNSTVPDIPGLREAVENSLINSRLYDGSGNIITYDFETGVKAFLDSPASKGVITKGLQERSSDLNFVIDHWAGNGKSDLTDPDEKSRFQSILAKNTKGEKRLTFDEILKMRDANVALETQYLNMPTQKQYMVKVKKKDGTIVTVAAGSNEYIKLHKQGATDVVKGKEKTVDPTKTDSALALKQYQENNKRIDKLVEDYTGYVEKKNEASGDMKGEYQTAIDMALKEIKTLRKTNDNLARKYGNKWGVPEPEPEKPKVPKTKVTETPETEVKSDFAPEGEMATQQTTTENPAKTWTIKMVNKYITGKNLTPEQTSEIKSKIKEKLIKITQLPTEQQSEALNNYSL